MRWASSSWNPPWKARASGASEAGPRNCDFLAFNFDFLGSILGFYQDFDFDFDFDSIWFDFDSILTS